MEKLKAYVVTKSSSDGSFELGDIIWMSKDESINSVRGGGWLDKDEWNQPGTNDFKCELSKDYVLIVSNGSEAIFKRSELEKQMKC